MAQPLVKEEVHELVDSLPEGATWDDLRYLIYVRTEIEKGRLSAREGKGKSNDEIREKFGLERLH